MTKFCEGCPNKGKVDGELFGVFSAEVKELPSGRIHSFITAFDEKYNPSRAFVLPSSVEEREFSFIKNIIDSCNGTVNGNCGSDAFAELAVPHSHEEEFLRIFRQYIIGLKYK